MIRRTALALAMFGAALVGTMAAGVWVGLLSAALGGVLIAAMLAVLAIRYLVDQVVAGIVLNLFALGITGFLYERLMQTDAAAYNPVRLFRSLRRLATSPILSKELWRELRSYNEVGFHPSDRDATELLEH